MDNMSKLWNQRGQKIGGGPVALLLVIIVVTLAPSGGILFLHFHLAAHITSFEMLLCYLAWYSILCQSADIILYVYCFSLH